MTREDVGCGVDVDSTGDGGRGADGGGAGRGAGGGGGGRETGGGGGGGAGGGACEGSEVGMGVGLVGSGGGAMGEGMGVGLVGALKMASWSGPTGVGWTGRLEVGGCVGDRGRVDSSWMIGLSVDVVAEWGRIGWWVRGLGVQPKGMTGRAVLCR